MDEFFPDSARQSTARGAGSRTFAAANPGATTEATTAMGRKPLPRAPAARTRADLVDALARTAAGDARAFELVYAMTSSKLYGIVLRIVGRRDVADDVLQDVYLRVWQRAADFDPAYASPITWLATIARNRALDEFKRKSMRSLDDCAEVLQIPSGDDLLADHLRNEEWQRLRACLDRLDPDTRQIILLVYHYGMTREEVAIKIGRPAATVKTWLRRGLAQVRQQLG